MHRTNPEIDIISDLLKAVLKENPGSVFISSLLHQYTERGSLSKKQLEGLHSKASKTNNIPQGKLATLQAIILKKPNRYKSEIITARPVVQKDVSAGEWIAAILAKYPQHKRILFFKLKYDKNEPLSAAEIAEIKKFHTLLL